MKKRILLVVSTLLLLLVVLGFNGNRAKATSRGAKAVYTTPVATRGTWYYEKKGKVNTVKITAHTLNGLKLYKALEGKAEKAWFKKLMKADKKSHYKLANKVSLSKYEAYTFTYRGKKGFNACGWLSGGGDGVYYAPVKKTIHGQKAKALRIGDGDHNYLKAFAYKNKNLLK